MTNGGSSGYKFNSSRGLKRRESSNANAVIDTLNEQISRFNQMAESVDTNDEKQQERLRQMKAAAKDVIDELNGKSDYEIAGLTGYSKMADTYFMNQVRAKMSEAAPKAAASSGARSATNSYEGKLNAIAAASAGGRYTYEVKTSNWEKGGKSRTYYSIVERAPGSKHYVTKDYGYYDNVANKYVPGKNDLSGTLYDFGGNNKVEYDDDKRKKKK